ncbi:hypothetical protein K5E71_18635, partial [Acinetobacter baumannii]|nr:hypothetical protein [Acinetobacter baumannii]
MKKYLIFFFLILSCSIASGCTKKILYLTPEATGYLYDSKTALLHKDLKCKAPLIEPNLRRNLG